MTQEKLYTYLGLNGTVTTPIQLQNVPAIINVRLRAEDGKVLTNDGGVSTTEIVTVPLGDVENWLEIDG